MVKNPPKIPDFMTKPKHSLQNLFGVLLWAEIQRIELHPNVIKNYREVPKEAKMAKNTRFHDKIKKLPSKSPWGASLSRDSTYWATSWRLISVIPERIASTMASWMNIYCSSVWTRWFRWPEKLKFYH